MAADTPRALTKAQTITALAERTGLSKQDITTVLTELAGVASEQLQDGAAGNFTVPFLCKISVQRKPATPARTMPNPFKPGEEMEVAAKPARNVVKVKPIKALSDQVS